MSVLLRCLDFPEKCLATSMETFPFPCFLFFLVLYSAQNGSYYKKLSGHVASVSTLNNPVEALLRVKVVQHFEKLLKSTESLK